MLVDFVEKKGTGIYLMKERSKLVRSKKNQTKHKLSQRLSQSHPDYEEMKIDSDYVTKRRKEDVKAAPLQTMSMKTPAKP